MTDKIRLTQQAKQDLLNVWLAIANDKPVAADRMYDRLERCIGILEHMPQAGALRPDIDSEARALVEWPYLILYREIESGVQIVRVLHGARDIDSSLFEQGFEH